MSKRIEYDDLAIVERKGKLMQLVSSDEANRIYRKQNGCCIACGKRGEVLQFRILHNGKWDKNASYELCTHCDKEESQVGE